MSLAASASLPSGGKTPRPYSRGGVLLADACCLVGRAAHIFSAGLCCSTYSTSALFLLKRLILAVKKNHNQPLLECFCEQFNGELEEWGFLFPLCSPCWGTDEWLPAAEAPAYCKDWHRLWDESTEDLWLLPD